MPKRLVAIREAAVLWLSSSGIRQWDTGEVSPEQIRAQIAAGEWYVHRAGGEIQGALRLLWSDPATWGEQPDDAAYVHGGLMIDRRFAGGRLAQRLLHWAEQRVLSAGRAFLRLDCVESNGRLRRYYREEGFREVRRRDLRNGWWPVTLFEKPV